MSLIRFGEFELDGQTFELRRKGVPTRIQQQPARVLALLLSHQGRMVTRDQIRNAVWGPDTFVDFEQGLNFCIRQIRIALNDHAEKPMFIETLPRLGYRFVAPIEMIDARKTPEERRLRIAMLPIEHLGGEVDDYFAAGLTYDMISALSRIDPARRTSPSHGSKQAVLPCRCTDSRYDRRKEIFPGPVASVTGYSAPPTG
jgi:DNA-binding winged helix-turn-helix (wHTH) protein